MPRKRRVRFWSCRCLGQPKSYRSLDERMRDYVEEMWSAGDGHTLACSHWLHRTWGICQVRENEFRFW